MSISLKENKMPKLLKPSQALTAVKKTLQMDDACDKDNQSPYICDNIGYLRKSGKITDETSTILRSHINTLLNNRFSLGDWLLHNGVSRADLVDDFKGRKLQFTRQLWLDDMIKHFKSKGM
jgi:hypothetical protein